ncbi:MAG: hypothetical protein KKI09_07530 [Spirochaetes bacterium]|nr:hypothetical protein [Spirochaetota bacterium]
MKTTRKTLRIARPDRGRGFHAPRYSPLLGRLVQLVGPFYMRHFEKMGAVGISGLDNLIDCFNEFNAGSARLILLFRHPSRKDPTVLAYAIARILPKLARQAGRPLKYRPHARFLYGKDVLNWAGPAAAWAFPRLGYIPVQNLGANKDGLDLLRKELKSGIFPVCLAPEGQVSYHMQQCAPLAAGFSMLAQWGLESGQDVLILPLNFEYDFGPDPLAQVQRLLQRWERESGCSLADLGRDEAKARETGPLADTDDHAAAENEAARLRRLLLAASDTSFGLLEQLYQLPAAKRDQDLMERKTAICHAALTAAEQMARLPHHGSLLERVFRIRYAGMERLHLEGVDPQTLPPLQRNLADFHALEATVYLRHQQVVDLLEYFDTEYIQDGCSPSRLCEFALNLVDILNRLRGGTINTRYNPPGQAVTVRAGQPVRLPAGSGSELSSKKKRAELQEEIYRRLQNLS